LTPRTAGFGAATSAQPCGTCSCRFGSRS
jgi:hypothetical protein